MDDIRELLQVFVRRFGIINAGCCETCCGEEVSLVQSHILFELRRQSEPSMQEVAEALGMDITTFSRQIKTLETKGLVTKNPDPGDKRVNVLALTQKGREIEERIGQHIRCYLEKAFSGMTEFERDTVVRSLKLLDRVLINSGTCCS